MNKSILTGKKVLVMGLGRFGGGVDAAKFAHKCGANVTVTDLSGAEKLRDSVASLDVLKDIEFHLEGHRVVDFEDAEVVIVNPAVPVDSDYLETARRGGAIITSQVNLFFELCPSPIVGITGSNGKSTTAALTAHLLGSGIGGEGFKFRSVRLSGNIGNKPMLMLLEEITDKDIVVVELSSFQLEQLGWIKRGPEVAVITNLSPNHLDRHVSFEKYIAAKENILRFQECSEVKPAVSIFNGEDAICLEWFDRYCFENFRSCFTFSADDVGESLRKRFLPAGRFNIMNLAAAICVSRYFNVAEDKILSSLGHFKPLPHRLEMLADIGGVRWYNDSISTTADSTIAALCAFDQPMVVIAGGYDKGVSFVRLGKVLAQKAKAVILLGETRQTIAAAVRAAGKDKFEVEFADSVADAVDIASRLAVKGDVVLFSPACASYDMFENFEQRGKEFNRCVCGTRKSYKSCES